MLILLGAALFGFGLLLFSLGVAIWLLGLALCFAIRLFQLTLLLMWAGVIVYSRLRQRPKVTVPLEGEILPPERQALPDRSHVRRLLLAAVMMLVTSAAMLSHASAAIDINARIRPEELKPGPKPASYCLRYGRDGLCTEYKFTQNTPHNR
jgi:hypothetical protein